MAEIRYYSITLGNFVEENDEKFFNKITENKFEWFRYVPTHWIIATPISVSTNSIIAMITECYGAIFTIVMEISINDVGGIFPFSKEDAKHLPKGWTPLQWFYKIKNENYIPAWERD